MQKAIIDGALNGASERLNDIVRNEEAFKELTGKGLPTSDDAQVLVSKAVGSMRKVLTKLNATGALDDAYKSNETLFKAVDDSATLALKEYAAGTSDRVIASAIEGQMVSSKQVMR